MVVVCWSLMATAALAQRMQFATPANEPASSSWSAGTTSTPVASPATVGPVPAAAAPNMAQPAPMQQAAPMQPAPMQPYASQPLYPGAPSQTIAPSPNYSVPPGTAPPAAGAAPANGFSSPTAPYGPPAYGSSVPYAPPPASFSGDIQPPTNNWDPYATPCAPQDSLLAQDPYLPTTGAPISMAAMQKLIQSINFEYAWFAGGSGSKDLGINDVELSATFGFPIFANPQTPLLVTPGFAVHYWQGPKSQGPTPADMPPRTYDAYLDFAWNPKPAPWFGAELEVRPGIYSDFDIFNSESFRVTGKGMGVITISPSVKAKLGIWYLDRNRVKLLPAGGIVWTPNPDVYFNILFPDPKIGRKLSTIGTTEWWIYGRGEYGGGNWMIRRDSGYPPPGVPSDGTHERVDYNDIEIAVGLEFTTIRHADGMFEVGGAFSRQLAYQNDSPHTFFPNNTVFVRAGLMY